ncbi:MAG TPA: hypothetical protein VFF88_07105 [Methylocella sp.]|nr:hypothetical protein [Methylocella sp.]
MLGTLGMTLRKRHAAAFKEIRPFNAPAFPASDQNAGPRLKRLIKASSGTESQAAGQLQLFRRVVPTDSAAGAAARAGRRNNDRRLQRQLHIPWPMAKRDWKKHG